MMNDNELLKMIKNKDEGAFNEFIQKYIFCVEPLVPERRR